MSPPPAPPRPPPPPGTTRYVAFIVPQHIRVARLWYLPRTAILATRSTPHRDGGRTNLEIVLLTEKEYVRARTYLAQAGGAAGGSGGAAQLTRGGTGSHPYAPQHLRILDIPDGAGAPYDYARNAPLVDELEALAAPQGDQPR